MFVGWRGALPDFGGGQRVRIPARDLFRVSFAGTRAIVLGADTIESLVPALTRAPLQPVRERVVLCDQIPHAYRVLRPWVEAGFGEPTAPSALADRIARIGRTHVRPILAPREWLPHLPASDSPAAGAVEAVSRLRRLTCVQDWADARGWTRDRLLTECRREFRLPPSALLHAHVLAVHSRLRRDGATQDECADLIGFTDVRSLRRAIARGTADVARSRKRSP